MKKLPAYIVSLDVETVGLHGQPFAWAAKVVDTATRKTMTELITACPFDLAQGPPDDREWVRDNVLTALKTPPDVDQDVGAAIFREVGSVEALLQAFVIFWNAWSSKKGGAWLLVDHGYPVEAEFLFNCFMESFQSPQFTVPFKVPYPVIDYASMRAAIGEDPTATLPRFESEKPPHNPLCDARQTVRLAFHIWDAHVTVKLVDQVEE